MSADNLTYTSQQHQNHIHSFCNVVCMSVVTFMKTLFLCAKP